MSDFTLGAPAWSGRRVWGRPARPRTRVEVTAAEGETVMLTIAIAAALATLAATVKGWVAW